MGRSDAQRAIDLPARGAVRPRNRAANLKGMLVQGDDRVTSKLETRLAEMTDRILGNLLDPAWTDRFRANSSERRYIVGSLRRAAAARAPISLFAQVRRPNPVAAARWVLSNRYRFGVGDPFIVTEPQDWGRIDQKERQHCIELNSFRHIDDILQAHKVSGNHEYLLIAVNAILDWMRYNVIDNRQNFYKWGDIATGMRSTALAYIFDRSLRSQEVPDDDIAMLADAVALHRSKLGEPAMDTGTNHAVFVYGGILALTAACPELPNTAAWLSRAEAGLTNLVHSQFGNEMLHREHSPSYHLWVAERFRSIVHQNWSSELGLLAATLDQACRNAIYLFHPNGEIASIGDSSRATVEANKDFSPEFTYVASGGQAGERPLKTDVIFPETGIAVLRSDWDLPRDQQSYLIFSAGYHSQVHKQADDLTFEWSERGRRLVVDTGTYSYKEGPNRVHSCSTRAHNTVEFDGKDYPANRNPYGSAFTGWQSANGIEVLSAGVFFDEPLNIRFERTLVLRKGAWLLIVDELSASAEHDFTQWLHFAPELEAVRRQGGIEMATATGDFGLEIVDLLASHRPAATELVRGQEEPHPLGWFWPHWGEAQPSYALGRTVRGSEIRFVTLLRITRDARHHAEPTRLEEMTEVNGRLKLRWRSSDGIEEILLPAKS